MANLKSRKRSRRRSRKKSLKQSRRRSQRFSSNSRKYKVHTKKKQKKRVQFSGTKTSRHHSNYKKQQANDSKAAKAVGVWMKAAAIAKKARDKAHNALSKAGRSKVISTQLKPAGSGLMRARRRRKEQLEVAGDLAKLFDELDLEDDEAFELANKLSKLNFGYNLRQQKRKSYSYDDYYNCKRKYKNIDDNIYDNTVFFIKATAQQEEAIKKDLLDNTFTVPDRNGDVTVPADKLPKWKLAYYLTAYTIFSTGMLGPSYNVVRKKLKKLYKRQWEELWENRGRILTSNDWTAADRERSARALRAMMEDLSHVEKNTEDPDAPVASKIFKETIDKLAADGLIQVIY